MDSSRDSSQTRQSRDREGNSRRGEEKKAQTRDNFIWNSVHESLKYFYGEEFELVGS